MPRHLEFPRPLSSDHDYWLCRCEGFRVDAPTGRLGSVEAVRFGARLDRPNELLVRGGLLATARLLFRCRMSRKSYRDSNDSSSAARQGKAATTSLRACAHTWAARLGREPAQGAGSAPITVPALARRDGTWAKTAVTGTADPPLPSVIPCAPSYSRTPTWVLSFGSSATPASTLGGKRVL